MTRPLVTKEISWRTPACAFEPLARRPFAALLQPGDKAEERNWAMIVDDPVSKVIYRDGVTVIDGRNIDIPPLEVLSSLHKSRRREIKNLGEFEDKRRPPFRTGFVGFIGYEVGGYIEPTGVGPKSPYELPDMAFGLYDASAVFDLQRQSALIVGSTNEAVANLEEKLGDENVPPLINSPYFVGSDTPQANYIKNILDIVDKIRQGDIYQANLSHRLKFEISDGQDFAAFCALMKESASPFGAFLSFGEGAILSNSPERFFRLSRREARWVLVADPIKGTRRRDSDPMQDHALASELQNDEKERAENIMIADLLRNDLSKICEDHSVNEDYVCKLESYAGVHHLVSRISGVLRDGLNAIDVIGALFPCGSITGAPKIEAMKVIGGLESVGRGPYCGAIGYIDDLGASEFSVSIRTIIADGTRREMYAPVGGGITFRSDPLHEYEETMLKAEAIFSAFNPR